MLAALPSCMSSPAPPTPSPPRVSLARSRPRLAAGCLLLGALLLPPAWLGLSALRSQVAPLLAAARGAPPCALVPAAPHGLGSSLVALVHGLARLGPSNLYWNSSAGPYTCGPGGWRPHLLVGPLPLAPPPGAARPRPGVILLPAAGGDDRGSSSSTAISSSKGTVNASAGAARECADWAFPSLSLLNKADRLLTTLSRTRAPCAALCAPLLAVWRLAPEVQAEADREWDRLTALADDRASGGGSPGAAAAPPPRRRRGPVVALQVRGGDKIRPRGPLAPGERGEVVAYPFEPALRRLARMAAAPPPPGDGPPPPPAAAASFFPGGRGGRARGGLRGGVCVVVGDDAGLGAEAGAAAARLLNCTVVSRQQGAGGGGGAAGGGHHVQTHFNAQPAAVRCAATKALLADIELLARAHAVAGLAQSNVMRVAGLLRLCRGGGTSPGGAQPPVGLAATVDWLGWDVHRTVCAAS